MRGPRFHTRLSDDAAQLNASIDFDQRLLPYDVAGSKVGTLQGLDGFIDLLRIRWNHAAGRYS